MCIKLQAGNRIYIPGTKAPIRHGMFEKDMIWGIDTGHGMHANARIESVLNGLWDKWGMIHHGGLKIDAFFEKKHKFQFHTPRIIGVIHNETNFLVVTEPAEGKVKKLHSRQPCYLHLNLLNLAS